MIVIEPSSLTLTVPFLRSSVATSLVVPVSSRFSKICSLVTWPSIWLIVVLVNEIEPDSSTVYDFSIVVVFKVVSPLNSCFSIFLKVNVLIMLPKFRLGESKSSRSSTVDSGL